MCGAEFMVIYSFLHSLVYFSFSMMDSNKDEVSGLLLNDTLEVFNIGRYTLGMQASMQVQYSQSS